MSLSPTAFPFFSCISSSNTNKRDSFVQKAFVSLSTFEFNLFTSILREWESNPSLNSLFFEWQNFIRDSGKPICSNLQVLSFNVRGLDLRWHEVLLLISSFNFDILILLETGKSDFPFYKKTCSDYKIFYQKGENKNGGVMVLVNAKIQVKRIECAIPNVVVIEFHELNKLRIIGTYAPSSKSWSWSDLSSFISSSCAIYGDFNVDMSLDKTKADQITKWAENHLLTHHIPDCPTSKRSKRTIDYFFSRGVDIDFQVYDGNTTSDHAPIISVIKVNFTLSNLGRRTHWNVFSLFSEFTFPFWEKNWNLACLDSTYGNYVRFLSLLTSRCTTYFCIKKYRSAIPGELRSFLSYIRALSFRQIRIKSPELKILVLQLKKIAKKELNLFFYNQMNNSLRNRNSTAQGASSFWFRSKCFIKPSSSSLNAFIDSGGKTIRDEMEMCEVAADYYEEFFKCPEVIRPHPYTDSPVIEFDNHDELIPDVSLEELVSTVQAKRKKKSLDAHGISNFMFNHLDLNHWTLLLKLFNLSFKESSLPLAWKDTKIVLLAKKESICSPSLTRPISLIDSFQKVGEKLFLTRFRDLLSRRGLIADNQSGFREGFRLQTRLLLFLEDVYSHLSNSAPTGTMFVDFRSAFDQLWFDGCIGKFQRLGIPKAYLRWIEAWLVNRRCFIEISGRRSRWFNLGKGGPQGSVLTPTIFITYNCDMSTSLPGVLCHFFADDLAAVISGQMGCKYASQVLDLEKRINSFTDHLEFYSALSLQPINFKKTECLFSSRAIGRPKFDVRFNSNNEIIHFIPEYKYLGYIISPKLGWGRFISHIKLLVRNRIARINSFKSFGCSSPTLRKILFSSFVLPFFTWMYPIFPLLSQYQRNDLSHFYSSSLRRVLHRLNISDSLFSFLLDEPSLEDRCFKYWCKYLTALSSSVDGNLLFENANLNLMRSLWLEGQFPIMCMRRSKRFIYNRSTIEKVCEWLSSVPINSSVINYEIDEITLLEEFPESFMYF